MLILASASPTRRQLFENAGLKFRVIPAEIDERATSQNAQNAKIDGPETALHLAKAKAESVSALRTGALVIGADQTLIHRGQPLHKPADITAARAQLRRLSGDTHHLHAAVALARNGQTLWSHVDTAQLTMRRFTDTEMQAVLAQEGPALLDCVGAYRIEGPSIRLFEKIDDDYFTILGLPLLALLEALRRHGIPT